MEKIRGFEAVTGKVDVILPTRGSKHSAGYDFYMPETVVIYPQETVKIYTGIKSYMPEGEVLLMNIRSGLGTKSGLIIANVQPWVDADYYSNPTNDGEIIIALKNTAMNIKLNGKAVLPNYDDVVEILAGERFVQGMFVKYGVADSGNTDKERTGGLGSTGTGV